MQLFGKCSQFCTVNAVSTYGYLCSCADGYILQQDNLTCLAFGRSYVRVSDHMLGYRAPPLYLGVHVKCSVVIKLLTICL